MHNHTTTCTLCRDESTSLNRIAGANVCDACRFGSPIPRLHASRGWNGTVVSGTELVFTGDWFRRVYFCRVRLQVPAVQGLRFTCRRRAGYWTPLSFVMPRLKVSDPLFNSACLVTAKTRQAAQSAIDSDHLQSALMDCIGDGGVLRVRDGWLLCNYLGQQGIEPSELVSNVAVSAHHLETSRDTWSALLP